MAVTFTQCAWVRVEPAAERVLIQPMQMCAQAWCVRYVRREGICNSTDQRRHQESRNWADISAITDRPHNSTDRETQRKVNGWPGKCKADVAAAQEYAQHGPRPSQV